MMKHVELTIKNLLGGIQNIHPYHCLDGDDDDNFDYDDYDIDETDLM